MRAEGIEHGDLGVVEESQGVKLQGVLPPGIDVPGDPSPEDLVNNHVGHVVEASPGQVVDPVSNVIPQVSLWARKGMGEPGSAGPGKGKPVDKRDV